MDDIYDSADKILYSECSFVANNDHYHLKDNGELGGQQEVSGSIDDDIEYRGTWKVIDNKLIINQRLGNQKETYKEVYEPTENSIIIKRKFKKSTGYYKVCEKFN